MRLKNVLIKNNFLIDKLAPLSSKKRFLLFICSFFALIPAFVCLMIPKFLYGMIIAKGLLFVLTFFFGYICWCTLFFCTSKRKTQNLLANIALVLLPIFILIHMWNMNQNLMTPAHFEKIDSQISPDRDYIAEAYMVEENDDGTQWIRIYLSYPESKQEYQNTKTQIYERTHLQGLSMKWENSHILLVNGEEIDVR